MRGCTLVIWTALALLTVTPGAVAQGGPLSLGVDVPDFPAPVAPLAGAGVTNFTVSVPCALLANAAPGGRATVSVSVGAPEWAELDVTPGEFVLDLSECVPSGTVARSGSLVARVEQHAPAFAPAPVVVQAVLDGPAGSFHGNGSGLVAAGYYAHLEVLAHEPARVALPGEGVEFPLFVRNRGNAPTEVAFTVRSAPDDWTVTLPARVEVDAESRTHDLVETVMTVRAPAKSGPGAATVSLAYASHLAHDASVKGDAGTFDVIVVIKDRLVPGPGGVLALAAVAGAAVALARRRP